MPQVELRYQISGARDGVAYPAPGSLLDVDDDEAAQLISIGAARHPVIETAEAATSETAAAPVVGLTTATAGTVETATV